ncbi:hypothetical protein SMUDGE_127 [Bacillus phage Smudge]|uniref:Uncharacterized protein n=1 Tax=Bacillus phage Smudge TaxID=1852566 RepID=A0A173H2N5_9CAUD|nr:hypothetical protein SMUDGE_127 [Bacillus phage Smudge]AOZ62380.1 hypothetical protein SBP8a_130 [Bacillus phage SBP8a]ASR78789.1 hypothetical protein AARONPHADGERS_137 [Bacillus phage AaronPhadgers]AUV57768.1 hypothetical protein HONESTABE_131 [Bacillus phage HonestAbe]QLF85995.1 hypothetical protein [Bacillus phage Tomato]UGO46380.1 hypothetical protein ABINADI_63 [Bacillus phage vB_BanH_Abinadi]
MQNRITDYIDGMIEAKLNNDGHTMLQLQKQYANMNVSVTDVGDAIVDSLEGVIQHVDAIQAIMEARMRVIVSHLEPQTMLNIIDELEEYGDYFIKLNKEEIK